MTDSHSQYVKQHGSSKCTQPPNVELILDTAISQTATLRASPKQINARIQSCGRLSRGQAAPDSVSHLCATEWALRQDPALPRSLLWLPLVTAAHARSAVCAEAPQIAVGRCVCEDRFPEFDSPSFQSLSCAQTTADHAQVPLNGRPSTFST